MQRPWGGTVSAAFEGQRGGLCGWSTGMRGRMAGGVGWTGMEAECTEPLDHGED